MTPTIATATAAAATPILKKESSEFSTDGTCVRKIHGPLLNPSPTIVVTGIVTSITACASYFVSEYIVDIVRTEAVFALGSYVVFASYFMFHYYLQQYSSSYRAVDQDKQFYTISNMIKAAVLAAMTPLALHLLWETLVEDKWHTQRIRNLGCLYAIPDFVSLLLVRKMSRATVVHHVCVCIFNYLSCQNDYSENNICRAIVVYAVFSTLAYLVNLLLASRFLDFSEKVVAALSLGSLIIYVGACVINWSWQAWYMQYLHANFPHWSIYAYCALMLLIVYDDLVLMKWLAKNISRRVDKTRKKN